jgi:hypothetical protein
MATDDNVPLDSHILLLYPNDPHEEDVLLPADDPYSPSDTDNEDSVTGLFGDSYLEEVLMESLQNLESTTQEISIYQYA